MPEVEASSKSSSVCFLYFGCILPIQGFADLDSAPVPHICIRAELSEGIIGAGCVVAQAREMAAVCENPQLSRYRRSWWVSPHRS